MEVELDLDADVPPLPKMVDGRTPFMKWVDGDGPPARPRSVYVASSWRNPYQPGVVAALRGRGLGVYDFRNPGPGEAGFSWRAIDPDWLNWTPAQWREALRHPVAKAGYANDRRGMDAADCCVLLLPCGRSAHLEAGYMAACGKPVLTLAPEPVEPDLMNLLLGPPDHICVTVDELLGTLGCPK